MATLPADIEPYITSAIALARKRIKKLEELQTNPDASPEELASWISSVFVYEEALQRLLSILGS